MKKKRKHIRFIRNQFFSSIPAHAYNYNDKSKMKYICSEWEWEWAWANTKENEWRKKNAQPNPWFDCSQIISVMNLAFVWCWRNTIDHRTHRHTLTSRNDRNFCCFESFFTSFRNLRSSVRCDCAVCVTLLHPSHNQCFFLLLRNRSRSYHKIFWCDYA